MNLKGCRECRFYIVDNYRQIICSFNGQIMYRDIYEGSNSRSMILTCPGYRSLKRGF
jgi:hypothetical protein